LRAGNLQRTLLEGMPPKGGFLLEDLGHEVGLGGGAAADLNLGGTGPDRGLGELAEQFSELACLPTRIHQDVVVLDPHLLGDLLEVRRSNADECVDDLLRHACGGLVDDRAVARRPFGIRVPWVVLTISDDGMDEAIADAVIEQMLEESCAGADHGDPALVQVRAAVISRVVGGGQLVGLGQGKRSMDTGHTLPKAVRRYQDVVGLFRSLHLIDHVVVAIADLTFMALDGATTIDAQDHDGGGVAVDVVGMDSLRTLQHRGR